jgi:hypothetical protein
MKNKVSLDWTIGNQSTRISMCLLALQRRDSAGYKKWHKFLSKKGRKYLEYLIKHDYRVN